ncbi:titin-like isoform X3 [Mizuhopecten yessoensis]|uniref:titin-like isoform X3 n=1 Tax=Mizuhopecten yessoensis TaxID=6573 RepID=UPI000B45DF09|nr:titin-like isoform X3 [Mizuhopecten yessoensis]
MLKWVRRRAMSAKTSRKEFSPKQFMKQPQNNGNVPITYPPEPPDDENMNEIVSDDVDLAVIMPDGKVKHVTVNSNIPMLDLLVNLAASSRLNPSGFTIVLLSEETGKAKDYKPNQTIGSLCVKSSESSNRGKRATLELKSKKLDKKSSAKQSQPFEMTYRFTVNLPQSQKKVLRISQTTPLETVHRQICGEKRLDPAHFIFKLPGDPQGMVDMSRTVGELGNNEINLIARTVTMDSAKSMPDLSVGRSQSVRLDPSPSYMPMAGEGKKKKGFFSFLKKDKKFNLQAAHMEVDRGPPPAPISGGSPPLRRKSDQQVARPRTMYTSSPAIDIDTRPKSLMVSQVEVLPEPKPKTNNQTVKEKVIPPPRTKKRKAPAPPPPQNQPPAKTVQVEISVEKQNIEKEAVMSDRLPSVNENEASNSMSATSEKNRTEQLAQKLHSRNSSDSSGYHELTLSGAESPDAGRIDENLQIIIDTTSIDSGEQMNGDSGIRDISPPRRKPHPAQTMEVGASQTLPLHKEEKKGPPRARSLERDEQKKKSQGKKRKAAPPPPPTAAIPPSSSDHPSPVANSQSVPPQPTVAITVVTATDPPPSSPPATEKTSGSPRTNDHELTTEDEDALAVAEVMAEFDRGLESPRMMMVENDSIKTEDIELEQPIKNQRPCSFVAPPPPMEPPPADSETVDYNIFIGSRVDMVDVGVETSDDSGSEGPESSPVSIHSRPESRNSVSSVNTIEDINMAFELTIAVAEQAMKDDTDNDEQDGKKVKEEASRFVKDMEKMNQEEVPIPQEEVITREMVLAEESYPTQRENQALGEADDMTKEEKRRSKSEDYEVSEITYNVMIDSAPPEFQDSEPVMEGVVDYNDKDEEEVTETIEVFSPFEYMRSTCPHDLTDGHARDDEEVKQKEVLVFNVEDLKSPESPRTSEVKPVAEPPQPPKVEVIKRPPTPPKEKQPEALVFTLDDLQNVNFSGARKREVQPPPQKTKQPSALASKEVIKLDKKEEEEEEEEVEVVVRRVYTEENEGFSNPVIDLDSLGVEDRGEISVKDRCTELSFSPNSEGEQEHVLEEKSISMINLPAKRQQTGGQGEEVIQSVRVEKSHSPRALFQEKSNDQVRSQHKLSVNDSGLDMEMNGSEVNEEEIGEGQKQQDLQNQFSQWQQQLVQNQALLSSTENLNTEDSSTQLQAQLQAQLKAQQEMMLKMQQSMQLLALQQQKAEREPIPAKVELLQTGPQKQQVVATPVTPPAAPPAPPPAPSLPQNGSVKTGGKGISTHDAKPASSLVVKPKGKGRRIIEPPKLDPREELMIAIRNSNGMNSLNQVPVKKTKWHKALH